MPPECTECDTAMHPFDASFSELCPGCHKKVPVQLRRLYCVRTIDGSDPMILEQRLTEAEIDHERQHPRRKSVPDID